MPKRIQRKRIKGWKMPPDTIYVGRGSIWGNPFKGEGAVEKYKKAVSIFPVSKKAFDEWEAVGGKKALLLDRSFFDMLKGKDLACWCPLDKPCHADVLLELVNEE